MEIAKWPSKVIPAWFRTHQKHTFYGHIGKIATLGFHEPKGE